MLKCPASMGRKSKITIFISIFLFSASALAANDIGKTLKFLSGSDIPIENRLTPMQYTFAENNIKNGIIVLESVLNHTYKTPENPKQIHKDIAAVNWALFHFAVNRDEPFLSGSYSIVEDDDQNSLLVFHENHPKAYDRKSSHHTELQKSLGIQARGIDHLGSFNSQLTDWTPSGREDELPVLAGNRSHLLFHPIPAEDASYLGKNILFIKPETNGTKKGFFKHAKNYIVKKGLGKVNHNYSKGEEIPESFAKDFEQYILEIQTQHQMNVEEYTRAAVIGVRAVHQAIQEIHAYRGQCGIEFSQELQNKENAILREINRLGRPEHVEYRTWNEVIFTHRELLALCRKPITFDKSWIAQKAKPQTPPAETKQKLL